MKSASEKRTKSPEANDERLAIFGDTPLPANPGEIVTMVIGEPAWLETHQTYRKLAESTLTEAGFVFESRELETRLLNDPAFPVELREATQLLWAINRLKRQTDQQKRESLSLEIGALGERIKARASQKFVHCGKKIKEGTRRGSEKVHGTPEEKASRWKTFQDELNRVCTTGMKYPKALERVAGTFNVHPRTIRRHTFDPTR